MIHDAAKKNGSFTLKYNVGFTALAAAVALSACGGGDSTSGSSTAKASAPPLKAYDLDTMIAISVGQHGWEQTIKNFTGKPVEFRYFPDRYDGSMGNRVLASSNSAAQCPVDESTFLAVQSRHSRFIVISGVIAPFSVDTPVKLNDCEVVKMDTDGWEPDPFEGQHHSPGSV